MKATLYVDGGARGNPGPAGIAALIKGEGGEVVVESCEYIGEASNNVAEYRALILGLDLALENGVGCISVINDSELVARQINGIYKVKHPDMRPLYIEAMERLNRFSEWEINNVPREENSEADALVNQAIDAAV